MILPGCALLAVLVLSVYWQTGRHAFIFFDDDAYLTANAAVRGGLARDGIAWAFSAPREYAYIPVTWLSHMADVSLFGMDPGRHHLAGAFLHGLNAILLFLGLRALSGCPWRSAFAAALFACHPLNVESVAWAAERKNLLSTFFLFLAIGAYGRYALRGSRGAYGAALLFTALGLLSKPMVVTIPACLLLLDLWPLGRLQPGKGALRGALPLIVEKLPFLLLSLATVVGTLLVQRPGLSIPTREMLPLWPRAGNAILSWTAYLGKAAWPTSLSILYPHRWDDPAIAPAAWEVAVAAVFLLATTTLVVRQASGRPWLAAGWLWYLGTLLPVIGLVQAGGHSMADRYAYLPLVGIFVAVAWGVPALLDALAPAWQGRTPVLVLLALGAIAALSARAWLQASRWKDSETLIRHSLAVSPGSWLLHYDLGVVLEGEGRAEEALAHYTEALRIWPDYALARAAAGKVLATQGKLDEAIPLLRRAVELRPEDADLRNNLGVAYLRKGDSAAAIDLFHQALRIDPGNPYSLKNLEIAAPPAAGRTTGDR